MEAGDRLVPRSSAAYREFARLHHIARTLRNCPVDRWNGDLYAIGPGQWGGFNPKTGAMRLADERVLRYLTGTTSLTEGYRQAQALATVLHESTHAGMLTDAPDEPNAVRSDHSLGLMEGVAELRADEDFTVFTVSAGYHGLGYFQPEYPAAHVATDSLVNQASGVVMPRRELLSNLFRGPGVMHFDQLADGVLRNRLSEVVPEWPTIGKRYERPSFPR